MDFGRADKSGITEKPVVVKPEVDSKTLSVSADLRILVTVDVEVRYGTNKAQDDKY
jgi:hypothetical protein